MRPNDGEYTEGMDFCQDMIEAYSGYLKKNVQPDPEAEFMLNFFKLMRKYWIPENNALYTDVCRKMLLAHIKFLTRERRTDNRWQQ